MERKLNPHPQQVCYSMLQKAHSLRRVGLFFILFFLFIRHNGGFPWWDLTGYGTKKRRQLCFYAMTVSRRILPTKIFVGSVVKPCPMKEDGSTVLPSSKSWMLKTNRNSWVASTATVTVRPKQVCCLRDLTPSGVGSLFLFLFFLYAITMGS